MKRILIDTDPGIDDSMAIFFALKSPEVSVEGSKNSRNSGKPPSSDGMSKPSAQNALRKLALGRKS